jgi:hypothetical protein
MKEGNEEVRAEMSVVWGGTEKSHVVKWSGSSFFSFSFLCLGRAQTVLR